MCYKLSCVYSYACDELMSVNCSDWFDSRNFPTKENIARKAQETADRRGRGEMIETKQYGSVSLCLHVCLCHCTCAYVCLRECVCVYVTMCMCVGERERAYICMYVSKCVSCVYGLCVCAHTHAHTQWHMYIHTYTPGLTDFNDFHLALMTLVPLTWPQWLSQSLYRKCSVSAKCVVEGEGGSLGDRTTGKITNSNDPIRNSPATVKCHHNWHKAACHKTAGPARRGRRQRRRIMGRTAAQTLPMHKLQTQRESNWRVSHV